jgi:hypothetical protein
VLVRGLERAGSDRVPELMRELKVIAAEPPTVADLRLTVASSYFDRLTDLVTQDLTALLQKKSGVDDVTETAAALARSDDRVRFDGAQRIVTLLMDLANFGAGAAQAAEWHIRGDEVRERDLRVLAARGAAALIGALRARDRLDEARIVARSTEAFLREPEYEAYARGAGRGAELESLLSVLDPASHDP